jgi:uncharacterized Zn finger protein
MKKNRDYRRRSKKDYYPKMDKQEKHDEVMQIKKDLVNFAKSSWGKKWIHSILKIGRPYRMRRAMRYAEDEGRISNLVIKKGEIFSLVQGTAPTPYRIRIYFETIPEKDWSLIGKDISRSLLNLINLIEGKLSDEIINIFESNHHSLFPDVSQGLNAKCSCPDQAVPCKHIAATILYISRVVDYNPLILLKLKGKKKKELLSELKVGAQVKSISSKKQVNIKKTTKKNIYSYNIPSMTIQDIAEREDTQNKMKDITFQINKPSKVIETLENLGLPPNLENRKAFAIVLDRIYRKVTNQTYKISLSK